MDPFFFIDGEDIATAPLPAPTAVVRNLPTYQLANRLRTLLEQRDAKNQKRAQAAAKLQEDKRRARAVKEIVRSFARLDQEERAVSASLFDHVLSYDFFQELEPIPSAQVLPEAIVEDISPVFEIYERRAAKRYAKIVLVKERERARQRARQNVKLFDEIISYDFTSNEIDDPIGKLFFKAVKEGEIENSILNVQALFENQGDEYDSREFSISENVSFPNDADQFGFAAYPFAEHYDHVDIDTNLRYTIREWKFSNAHVMMMGLTPPVQKYASTWFSSTMQDEHDIIHQWSDVHARYDTEHTVESKNNLYTYDSINLEYVVKRFGYICQNLDNCEAFHAITQLFKSVGDNVRMTFVMNFRLARALRSGTKNDLEDFLITHHTVPITLRNLTKAQFIAGTINANDYEQYDNEQKMAIHFLLIADKYIDKRVEDMRSSTGEIPIYRVENLSIKIKIHTTVAGGCVPKSQHASEFFSPTDRFGCLYSCLRHVGIIAGKEDMDLIAKTSENINLQCVSISKLKQILAIVDKTGRFKVVVYKFSEATGRLNSGTVYRGSTAETPATLVKLLTHKGHCMVIKRDNLSGITPDMFIETAELVDEPINVELQEHDAIPIGPAKKINEQRARKGFTRPQLFMWDTETYDSRREGFEIFQLSVTQVSKMIIVNPNAVVDKKDGIFRDRKKNEPLIMDGRYRLAESLRDQMSFDANFEKMLETIISTSEDENPKMTDIGMSYYGKDCVRRFCLYLDRICDQKEAEYKTKVRSIMNNAGLLEEYEPIIKNYKDLYDYTMRCVAEMDAAKVQFWAHNSSRFDSILLLKDKIARDNITSMLKSGGILTFTYRNIISFKDSFRFSLCGLNDFCRDMKIPDYLSKTTAPYTFAKANTLHYIGDVPDEKFWPDGKVPARNIWARPGERTFDMRYFFTKYAIMDTVSLAICMHRFAYTLYRATMQLNVRIGADGERVLEQDNNSTGLNMYEYVTLASFSEAIMKEYVNAGYGGQRADQFNERHKSYMSPNSWEHLRYFNVRFDEADREKYAKALKRKQMPVYNYDRLGLDFKGLIDSESHMPRSYMKYITKEERAKRETEDSDKIVHVCRNAYIDAYIRLAIRGGRSVPNKAKFMSEGYDPTKKDKPLYDALKDFMIVLDATSLYPTVMHLFEFPTGKPRFLPVTDFEGHRAILNSGAELPKYSIITCTVTHTKKDLAFPLLTVRDGGRNKYNFDDKEVTLSNVDIQEAIKYNYVQVTAIKRVLEWPGRRRIFSGVIERYFAMRLAAKKVKDKLMDTITKLIMNIMYGITVKELIDTHTEIVGDNDAFEEALAKREVVDFYPFGDRMKIDSKRPLSELRAATPSQIGVFILSFSKKLMNDCVNEFDGFGCKARIRYEEGEITYGEFYAEMWDRAPYYTDTDSLYIRNKYYDELIDTPTGPKKNPWGLDWVFPYFDRTTIGPSDKAAIGKLNSAGKHLESFNYFPETGVKLNGQLSQFHDDANDDLFNPRVYEAHFIAPKCKLINYVALGPKNDPAKDWDPMAGRDVEKRNHYKWCKGGIVYEQKGTFKGVKTDRDKLLYSFDNKSQRDVKVSANGATQLISDRGGVRNRNMDDITSITTNVKGGEATTISVDSETQFDDDLTQQYRDMSQGIAKVIKQSQFEKTFGKGFGIHHPEKTKVVNSRAYQGKQKIGNNFFAYGYEVPAGWMIDHDGICVAC